MKSKMENPAALAGANRVLDIKTLAGVDVWNPTEAYHEFQSESLAVATVMRRFGLGFYHAQVVCRHSGLGGSRA